ncbi:hypothetical protein G7054_g2966 [Neopestalotiopsis clavispora]|nr:hypothetical protein G7054_g2966 [Neopestalotiopsis clavispora]
MPPVPGQKCVLITGCTPGGIGHALAVEYEKQGLYVFATARTPAVIADLAGPNISVLQLDVTDSTSISNCQSEVDRIAGGRLDILINNAGRTHTHPALDISIPDVRETFETNVIGVMAMVAAFGGLLIKAEGLIINIASLAAVTPYVFGSVFGATKGAIMSYSRILRQELRPFNVRVMVLMTGFVKTGTKTIHRTLPEDSFYDRIRHLFEKRVTYSKSTSTLSPKEYALDIVEKSLRSERHPVLRAWFGRPDWYWSGGKAREVWWGQTIFGELLTDAVCWKTFQLEKLQRLVLQDRKR